MEYTTINKNIKEFDVMITNDPKQLGNWDHMDDLQRKNLLRIYCVHDDKWATFVITAQALKDLKHCDNFIYTMLKHQFAKLSKP